MTIAKVAKVATESLMHGLTDAGKGGLASFGHGTSHNFMSDILAVTAGSVVMQYANNAGAPSPGPKGMA